MKINEVAGKVDVTKISEKVSALFRVLADAYGKNSNEYLSALTITKELYMSSGASAVPEVEEKLELMFPGEMVWGTLRDL